MTSLYEERLGLDKFPVLYPLEMGYSTEHLPYC